MRERHFTFAGTPARGYKHAVLTFFAAQRNTIRVDSMATNVAYRRRGIDALWWFTSGGVEHVRSLEVRVSHASTPMCYLETTANINTRVPGWAVRSAADYLCIAFDALDTLLILPTHALQDFLRTAQHGGSYRRISVPASHGQGSAGARAEGLLVPVADVASGVSGAVTVRDFHAGQFDTGAANALRRIKNAAGDWLRSELGF